MSKVKILAVDDDADLVETIRVVLEADGYEVIAAADAASGLERVHAERPDLILLDVMMPSGTEGFHFVWKLRRLPESYFREVPIIMLTSIHERTSLRFYPETADGTYRPGEYLPVQEFIEKPVAPADLRARVARLLAVSRNP